MLAEKKRETNIGVRIGFVVQLLGNVLQARGGALVAIGLVLVLVGLVIFIWGCMSYCEGKGYSKWLGLLGLLSIIGLLVLVFLPDRYRSLSQGTRLG